MNYSTRLSLTITMSEVGVGADGEEERERESETPCLPFMSFPSFLATLIQPLQANHHLTGFCPICSPGVSDEDIQTEMALEGGWGVKSLSKLVIQELQKFQPSPSTRQVISKERESDGWPIGFSTLILNIVNKTRRKTILYDFHLKPFFFF